MRGIVYLVILGIAVSVLLIRRNRTHAGRDGDVAEEEQVWCCPECHEPIPMTFCVCWNCGQPKVQARDEDNSPETPQL